MSENTFFKRKGQPLKLVIDIQSNENKELAVKTLEDQKKIAYAPGILKFITMLVEDMVKQDLARKE